MGARLEIRQTVARGRGVSSTVVSCRAVGQIRSLRRDGTGRNAMS